MLVLQTAGWALQSPSGQYHVNFQTDGNLVVYRGSTALWSSRTSGQCGSADNYCALEFNGYANELCCGPDGQIVVDDPGRSWHNINNPESYSAFRVVMQDDGNFVEYSGTSGGTALWATYTNT